MKKSIITILAFTLFALAGFAQEKEFVLIRIEYNVKGAVFYTYRNERVTKEGPTIYKASEDMIKAVGDFLKAYYTKGYKLVSAGKTQYYDEYIFEKD